MTNIRSLVKPVYGSTATRVAMSTALVLVYCLPVGGYMAVYCLGRSRDARRLLRPS